MHSSTGVTINIHSRQTLPGHYLLFTEDAEVIKVLRVKCVPATSEAEGITL